MSFEYDFMNIIYIIQKAIMIIDLSKKIIKTNLNLFNLDIIDNLEQNERFA